MLFKLCGVQTKEMPVGHISYEICTPHCVRSQKNVEDLKSEIKKFLFAVTFCCLLDIYRLNWEIVAL